MHTKSLAWQRWMTHGLVGGMLLLLSVLSSQLFPVGKQGEIMLIALGYLCLFLTGVTLVIGPLNLLRRRRNPVNIFLRRDLGIWAGITGCLHVLFVVRGNFHDNQILLFFLRRDAHGYTLLLTIYGLSNDLGLLATLCLLLLLALSNMVTLRWLKGKRWKWLQRSTYLLALLALAHTFGFELLNLRGSLWSGVIIIFSTLVLACQAGGIVLMVIRRRRERRHIKTLLSAQG